MATEIVADHVELARDFLARSKSYLAQGDLHQASRLSRLLTVGSTSGTTILIPL